MIAAVCEGYHPVGAIAFGCVTNHFFLTTHKTKSVYEFLPRNATHRSFHMRDVWLIRCTRSHPQRHCIVHKMKVWSWNRPQLAMVSRDTRKLHLSTSMSINHMALETIPVSKSKNPILQINESNGKWSIRMCVIAQCQRLSLSLYVGTRFHEITCRKCKLEGHSITPRNASGVYLQNAHDPSKNEN